MSDRSPSVSSVCSDETLHSPVSPSFLYDAKDLKGRASRSDVSESQQRHKDDFRYDVSETGIRQKVWIPAHHRHRTLVLCFDGTGDQFDSDNSNVVQFVSMLRKDDTSQQLVYYQPGIGTYTGTNMPIVATISKTLDEMFAMNISSHIKDGYQFLMNNYTDGDKICLFGFSRGAYTARALAGMLQKVGLLPRSNDAQLYFAYDMYAKTATNADDKDFDEQVILVEIFKRTFCRDVKVEFLGVWDTVNSVGLIPRTLPFVYMNNGVRHLRHALSLDERRVRFVPSFASAYVPRQAAQDGERAEQRFEDAVNAAAGAHCDVREVWFAGVHADVGGGSVKNNTRHALARIPLRWMVREAFRCGTGLIFDAAMLQQIGLSLDVAPDTTSTGTTTISLADPPPRLAAHEVHAYPDLTVELEAAEDAADATDAREDARAKESWGWRALRTAGALLAAPFRALFGPRARKDRLSDTARLRGGRHVVPSRMHPAHARAAHGHGHDHCRRPTGTAPPLTPQLPPPLHEDLHALDTAHTAAQDPMYEAVEELADALSVMHDQLTSAGGWMRLLWLAMEYLPAWVRVERPPHVQPGHSADAWEWWSRPGHDRSVWKWVRNCGRGRVVTDDVLRPGMHVHRSVKTRLEAQGVRLRTVHRRGEVYVPQVRPAVPRGDGEALPERLKHCEWNVEVPAHWEWVD